MKLGHTIDDSRKKYPELTNELLEDLQTWAKEHGLAQIPDEQLALFAHSCYFDPQTAKQCMEVYYRMRTTNPEFFNNRDVRLEYLQHSLKVLEFTALPKLDHNGYRILFHRIVDTRPFQYMFNDGIKLMLMTIEASLYTDGCLPGYVFVFDMQGMRFRHITRLSIKSIQKFFEYLQGGMPIRLKAIHILNTVWFMDKLLALVRPFMSRKIYEMIHFHTSDISDVYPYIPLDCLPKDFGGEFDYVANLHKSHSMKLDQLRDYFREDEALSHNYIPNNEKTRSNQLVQNSTNNSKK